jgi:hypothetical protein
MDGWMHEGGREVRVAHDKPSQALILFLPLLTRRAHGVVSIR